MTSEDLVRMGVQVEEAEELATRIRACLGVKPPTEAWRRLTLEVLRPEQPFALHQELFRRVYAGWNVANGPPPAWLPAPVEVESTNLYRLMTAVGTASVGDLHAWSVENPASFWEQMVGLLGIRFARTYETVLDLSRGAESARWFTSARLNIAESCFQADGADVAIIERNESGQRRAVTYGSLLELVQRTAGALAASGLTQGDVVAIYLPMKIEAVVIYLATIWAGGVVASLADSLAPPEIVRRLRIAQPRFAFTQDHILRAGKRLPLFAKLKAADGPRAVVLACDESRGPGAGELRSGDIAWTEFLGAQACQNAAISEPEAATNILFSSGTTADPKAIPWTQLTPIKAAADAWLYQDVRPGDRITWPTNLGWMMGPWLIYAGLVNRATIVLFDGAPTGREFAQFVADESVTLLGVIPTLVKTWRDRNCTAGVDWQSIRAFSSTGECSNPEDMFWLMSRASYRPIIEYCGGTEIGGGYIASTQLLPNIPATFSTPALGIGLVLVDESGQLAERGEVLLEGPSIGLSNRLLNADHHEVYYAGLPASPTGLPRRRHGDFLARLPGGYYRAHGRVDDTMNLGGIKTSSVEIERVIVSVPGIEDAAAVGIPPREGGPDRLVVAIVLPAGLSPDEVTWRDTLQEAIRHQLNPLFRIERLLIVDQLPRTASNKLLRRVLREELASDVGRI